MQASKNFSDIWLVHWIMNIKVPNATLHTTEPTFDVKTYAESIKEKVICILGNFARLHESMECFNATGINDTEHNDEQISSNSYYLAIYISIAIFNSIIALIRAFSFAYAGLKAAKFIHNRLLKSVFHVSSL